MRKLKGVITAMERKYSLVFLTYNGWSPAETIYNANLIGYDCVSLRTIPQGLPGERNNEITGNNERYRATRQALEDTGMVMNDTELAKIDAGTDVTTYRPHLEAAASLGVRNIVTNIWVDDREFYIEAFAKLCDIAAEFSMVVNLEFVTWSKVRNLAEARHIIEAAGRSNAAVLIDTLHFHRSRVTLEELASCPKELIRIAHICDAPPGFPTDEASLIHTGRAERLYPGDGVVDIAGIVKLLGDHVVLGVEVPNNVIAERIGPTEHARRCLERTKQYMKAHGLE